MPIPTHPRLSARELDELYAMLMKEALRITHDMDDALDLVQESLTTTLEQIANGKTVLFFKAYCFKVLRAQQCRYLKSKESRTGQNAEEPCCPMESPTRCLLQECLAQLPQKQRQAVVLHDLAGKPLDEVARQMNLSESYLVKLLGRAHSELKKIISQ